jgi:predicted RNA binding protein YcfA (HicA-like mRNA interferase family)
MLVLDSSDLVNVSLRNKPPLSGLGVTPTATTAAGPAAAMTTSTTAVDGGEMSSLENRGFRFLATLGGHVQLHHAVKVRKLHTVGQDCIPSSVQSGALIPTSK